MHNAIGSYEEYLECEEQISFDKGELDCTDALKLILILRKLITTGHYDTYEQETCEQGHEHTTVSVEGCTPDSVVRELVTIVSDHRPDTKSEGTIVQIHITTPLGPTNTDVWSSCKMLLTDVVAASGYGTLEFTQISDDTFVIRQCIDWSCTQENLAKVRVQSNRLKIELL